MAKILPYQQGDFEALYESLEGNPVCIRFLDPPLHEFVPTEEKDIEALAKAKGKSVSEIKILCDSLHEFNPMMGHRGCRLAVTYPEIAVMQTKAVRLAFRFGEKRNVVFVRRHEFVQRRIEETNGNGLTLERFHKPFEVGLLHRFDRVERLDQDRARGSQQRIFRKNHETRRQV